MRIPEETVKIFNIETVKIFDINYRGEVYSKGPIPRAPSEGKILETRIKKEREEIPSAISAINDVRDTLATSAGQFMLIPTIQFESYARAEISRMQEAQNRKLSDKETERIYAREIEKYLIEGTALEEAAAEEVILCNDLEVIVKKIRHARRAGTVVSYARKLRSLADIESVNVERGIKYLKEIDKHSITKILDDISYLRDTSPSELGKEAQAAIEKMERPIKRGVLARELIAVAKSAEREVEVSRIMDVVRDAIRARDYERVKGLLEDFKNLQKLLAACREDLRILRRAARELPALVDRPEEFYRRCEEIFARRPEFLREIRARKIKPKELVDYCRKWLEELEANRYVQRLRLILVRSAAQGARAARGGKDCYGCYRNAARGCSP